MLTQGSLTSPSFSLMVIYQLGECSGVAQFSWEWYCCIIQPSLRDHINTCIEEHGKTNKTFNLKSSLRKSNNFFFSLQISDQSLQDFAMLQSHHSRKFNQSPGVLCDLATNTATFWEIWQISVVFLFSSIRAVDKHFVTAKHSQKTCWNVWTTGTTNHCEAVPSKAILFM